jgi:peptidoglycan hydrolase CwlO-like protein
MSAPDPTPGWLGAAVTVCIALVGAIFALIRRLLSTVTREELADMMEKMEKRHEDVMRELEARQEKKIEDMRQTILALHKDNKDSRHRLRDSLTDPVNKLNAEIIRLRESLDR